MRYLIINYFRKPNGQMDEVVSVSKSLKMRDIQSASVILDFRRQQVVKCSLQGQNVAKDWNRVVGFYYQHYQSTIDLLARAHGLVVRRQEPEVEKDHTH